MKYLAGESQRTVDLASSMLGARRRMRGLRKNRTEVIMESVHNKNALVFTGLIRENRDRQNDPPENVQEGMYERR